MSGDYSVQKPIMEWNTKMKWWNTSEVDLLLQLSLPFLGTWPTSGMTQNGQVFELPMPGHHTTDLESSSSPTLPTPRAQEPGSTSPGYGDSLNDFASRVSTGYAPKDLLRSPTASQGEGGALGEEEARRRGNTVGIRDQAMDLALANGHKVSRAELMPTPAVSDNRGAARSEVDAGDPKHRLKVAVELLPTTRTSMKNGATQKEIDAGNPKFRIEAVTNWGKFEPAIKRWEQVAGRKAPAPTKPDGKDGSHRLSSAFTEWMMGVPEGWITDCGLSRNDELKACGNGVVPQQAELALRILLEGIAFESTGGGQVNLPTPTVSDIFTDKLASSQQKEGSMHSVTLPQAVRMVADTIETGRAR